MHSKKQIILVPVIAFIALVIIGTVAFTLLSNLPKDDGMVTVEEEFFDGTVLNFGKWKGTLSSLEYCIVELDDIDGFMEYVRNCEYFDEKLVFKNSNSPFSTVIYLVVSGKVFTLRFFDNRVWLVPLEKKYYDVQYKSHLMRFMWVPVDTYVTHDMNPKTRRYDTPGKWDADVTMDDVKYLYSKVDPEMYEITDEGIFVKGYAAIIDEVSWELISYEPTDKYGVKIFEDESGNVMVDVIYP